MRSTLDLFGLFVHFGSIQSILSTSVLSGPHCFYSVHLSPICPLWSDLVHSVYVSSVQSIRSYLVHLVPIRSFRSFFCPFGPFGSLRFILICFNLFLCTYIMKKDMFGLKTTNLNLNLKYIYIYI